MRNCNQTTGSWVAKVRLSRNLLFKKLNSVAHEDTFLQADVDFPRKSHSGMSTSGYQDDDCSRNWSQLSNRTIIKNASRIAKPCFPKSACENPRSAFRAFIDVKVCFSRKLLSEKSKSDFQEDYCLRRQSQVMEVSFTECIKEFLEENQPNAESDCDI